MFNFRGRLTAGRKATFGFIFAAVAAVAMTQFPQTAVAGDQDFTIVNATGYTISEVYVSPAKASDWEEDVLGRDVLADGERQEIRFSRDTDACKWDLKVVYEDDNSSAEWGALNLCEISVVRLMYNRKSGETSATVE